MPFRKLVLQPGCDLEQSATLNQTRFYSALLCRFYDGLVQKIGGWLQLTAQTFFGVCRGLWGWSDIIGNSYLAVGTNQRLEVLIGGVLSDITPLETTTNPAVSFSTSIGSPTVTITDAGYNPAVGDWLNLVTQVSVGGIVLFGFYQVKTVTSGTTYTITAAQNATANVTNGGAVPLYTTMNTSAIVQVTLDNHGFTAGSSVFEALVSTTVATVIISGSYVVTTRIDANNFTITASTPANASTTGSENGGDARIEYLLPSGYAVNTAVTGYGTGFYGAGPYGVGSGGRVVQPLRQWSFGNFGQDLIANPTNGGIYYWVPPTPAPATVVSGSAPLYSSSIFIFAGAQIVVALGAETGGTQEPLLGRWCDAGDFTDWNASTTNQAGSYFFSSGSALVGGLALGLGAVIWTDVGVWAMNYLGFPLVFGFTPLAVGCGLIAQRAAGTTGSLIMWLSTRGFFQMQVGGGVSAMECPVWDFLFANLDPAQTGQIHCAVNSLFNEMAWFFPIAQSSAIYSSAAPLGYVKYNYVENCWDYGQSSQYQRTAWVGVSAVGNPVGADTAGLLQQHETSPDANGSPMVGGWQTGYFDLLEGEEFAFIDLLIPDSVLEWANAPPVFAVELLATDYPIGLPDGAGLGLPLVDGPYVIDTSQPGATLMVPVRIRARQIAIAMSWSDLGTFNRLGALRYRFAPDGRN
jgi:hypothetical protein